MHTEVLYLPNTQTIEIGTFCSKSIKSSKCTCMFCTCLTPKNREIVTFAPDPFISSKCTPMFCTCLTPKLTTLPLLANDVLFLPNTKMPTKSNTVKKE